MSLPPICVQMNVLPPLPLPPARTMVWVVLLITVTVDVEAGRVTVVTVPFFVTVVTVPVNVTVLVEAGRVTVVTVPFCVDVVVLPGTVTVVVEFVPPDTLVGQVDAVVTPALVVFPVDVCWLVAEVEP